MHAEALQSFINDCVTNTVMADMLEEGQEDECKASAKALRANNQQADSHIMGAKAAIKRYTKQFGN